MQYIYDDNDDTIYKVKMNQEQFDRNGPVLLYGRETSVFWWEVTVTPMMSDIGVGLRSRSGDCVMGLSILQPTWKLFQV